jgi:uncharacterized membrane protein
MIDAHNLLAILFMASATYLTRTVGFIALRNRKLGVRATKVLQAVPGCVLISVIAPAFASGRPADAVSLAITLGAATRLSMLPTVTIGIVSAALLRQIMP